MGPGYLDRDAHVDQGQWVKEFSQYDGGWLPFDESEDRGELRRANWDDLNYPARLTTLVAAGLPVLQRDNRGSVVATQTVARERNLGLLFSHMGELGEQLRDAERMEELRESVWRQREEFTFDFHADRLVAFFREVIDRRPRRGRR